jgi:hypothetical protein
LLKLFGKSRKLDFRFSIRRKSNISIHNGSVDPPQFLDTFGKSLCKLDYCISTSLVIFFFSYILSYSFQR